MKFESFWEKDINIKNDNFKKLDKDIDVDVLIIGGGLAGISTAYYLRNSNLKIALVEQGFVGCGVTSKTTGKINYLQETIYSDLETMYSFDIAKKYYDSQKFAINELLNIIKAENIECNLEKVESFVYANKTMEIENIKFEKDILERFGCLVKEYDGIDIDLNSKYAISVSDTYVFHPLKFLYALKNIILENNVDIYEQTRIIGMKKNSNGYICRTSKNTIKAKKVILTCHYPFFLKPYLMPLKVYTEKSYVVVGKVKKCDNKSFITSSNPCISIRYFNDDNKYMFYLSNSHNLCNKLNEEDNFDEVLEYAQKVGLDVEYVWSNDDVISIDRIPYIGKIEKDNDNLLIGTGFSTWGMTNSVLSGYVLSNMIMNNHTRYDDIFNPLRVNLTSCFVNIGSNLKSYVENKINKNKKWYKSNVKYETRNGKNVAIYIDSDNVEHIVMSNCPHMGCTLIFNEVEKTWDCPCHASRFDVDGKCIKGPSVYDITYKE